MAEVTLRPIDDDDISEWLDLRQSLFPALDRSYHLEEMKLARDSPEGDAFFCVSADGRVVGLLEVTLRSFVDGCLGGPVGYIDSLFILPQCRGKGLGKEIVERAAEWFDSRGCREMATDTDLSNLEGQGFFRSIGFTETYRIVQFKRAVSPRAGGPLQRS